MFHLLVNPPVSVQIRQAEADVMPVRGYIMRRISGVSIHTDVI